MVTLIEATVIHAPVERCFDLARSVEVHLKGNIHSGEATVVTEGVSSGLIGPNQKVTWSARHFGIRQKLTSVTTASNPPFSFRDEMVEGAISYMRHDHLFRVVSLCETQMEDVFCFAAPLGVLGLIAEALVLRSYMRELLRERNRVLKDVAESDDWKNYRL
jgi:ligand-binding SRPBCC domain-containing protein